MGGSIRRGRRYQSLCKGEPQEPGPPLPAAPGAPESIAGVRSALGRRLEEQWGKKGAFI